jgi:hypothetical protein
MALRILPIVIDHWIRPTNVHCKEKFLNRLRHIYVQRALVYRFRSKTTILHNYFLLRFFQQIIDDTHEDDDSLQEENTLVHDIRQLLEEMVTLKTVWGLCRVCHSHLIIIDSSYTEENDLSTTVFTCQSRTCTYVCNFTIPSV